ncbi:MAG: nuclear transport factor 2 family protein [Lautropia sp.]
MTIDHAALAGLLPELTQRTNRFYWCLDEFRYQELVSLMEPEAVWHRQGKVLRGHAQVLAALAERPATMRIRHVITNVFVADAGPDTADVVAYMTAYRHDDGSDRPLPRSIPGPFRVLLVKMRFRRRDGQWLIAEQAATSEFEFAPA